MPITLNRALPPSHPSDLVGFEDHGQAVSLEDNGRLICRGEAIPPEVTNSAFNGAAVEIFGRQWQTPLGIVFDIRRPDRWRRDNREPPANITKWVAWVAAMESPRTIGALCVTLTLDPDGEEVSSARMALLEVC